MGVNRRLWGVGLESEKMDLLKGPFATDEGGMVIRNLPLCT
jgi:hypothetical protein